MSLVSGAIGTAKKLKHKFQDEIKAATPIYISPVRRISGVRLNQRICAMTFDDGPSMLPPNPDSSGTGKALTLQLLETLERHGAKGTFDCIGDTSENYPDDCGKPGTAMWGGVAYDHYPVFGKDDLAGVKNCPELVRRIIAGGHEISSHSYVHRIWGAKPLVYGKRKYMNGIDEVISDLQRFDTMMQDCYDYKPCLSRPPHYVDKISKNFSSYDAYAVLGYQYMAAGPDGGGWLPAESYEKEVALMESAIKNVLDTNPDAFCGAIIFQKDGCNMMMRTPVADALELQLKILDEYGYKVVTVSQLMALSQFADCGPEDEAYNYAKAMLSKGMCPAFSDNSLHLERSVTRPEIAMMLYGWEATVLRVADKANGGSAYDYAVQIAKTHGMDLDAFDLSLPRIEILKQLSEI